MSEITLSVENDFRFVCDTFSSVREYSAQNHPTVRNSAQQSHSPAPAIGAPERRKVESDLQVLVSLNLTSQVNNLA